MNAKLGTVAVATLASAVLLAACDGKDKSVSSGSNKPPSVGSSSIAVPAKKAPVVPLVQAPSYTVAQENAIGSAESYLESQAFSKAGLIDQLSSEYGEGFNRADAEFAVNHIKVDWNSEAVAAAKEYLQTQHFSRSGLIEQLTSEYGSQFTLAQAIYAADHVGLH